MYKYSGARGAQTDRAFWLKAYNGGSHTVDRITRGQTYISHLSVSILGGVQPGPISKLAKVGDDDGLMQRFIPIMARPAGLGRDEAPGDAVADYTQLIEDLRELEPPPNAGYVFPPTVPLIFDDQRAENPRGAGKEAPRPHEDRVPQPQARLAFRQIQRASSPDCA